MSDMREQLNSIQKYDTGIAEYIDAHDAYDRTAGDVEAPTGWFGQAGRRVITHDSQGFVSTQRFATREEAQAEYERLDDAFVEWAHEPYEDCEDGHEYTPGVTFENGDRVMRYCAICGAPDLVRMRGDLLDELRYAEGVIAQEGE